MSGGILPKVSVISYIINYILKNGVVFWKDFQDILGTVKYLAVFPRTEILREVRMIWMTFNHLVSWDFPWFRINFLKELKI